MGCSGKVVLGVAVSFVWSCCFAQTASERKAAAEAWLAKKEIRIHYVGPYESKFTVDLKDKTAVFYNSPDRWCASGPVPTDVTVNGDGMLVLNFDFGKRDCMQIRYTFDPITKVGVSEGRAGTASGEDPWRTSSSKITLIE